MPFSCVFDFLDIKKKKKIVCVGGGGCPDSLKVSVVVIAGLQPHILLHGGSKTPTL